MDSYVTPEQAKEFLESDDSQGIPASYIKRAANVIDEHYFAFKIKLRGGYRDGLGLIVPDAMDVIGVPRIEFAFDKAEPITPNTVKRHSWDEDALTISYDRYRRTDAVVDGHIVYEPVE